MANAEAHHNIEISSRLIEHFSLHDRIAHNSTGSGYVLFRHTYAGFQE